VTGTQTPFNDVELRWTYYDSVERLDKERSLFIHPTTRKCRPIARLMGVPLANGRARTAFRLRT